MDPIIGQIQLFAFNFAPSGWAFCNGQTIPMQSNLALYALIYTWYGGDGKTNFALPNLQGAEPIPGTHYCIAVQGLFPARD